MTEDPLARIQRWYARQCDGEWEHGYGLDITTLDNPGWRVRIQLNETPLAAKLFEPVKFEDDAHWLDCKVKNSVFEGAGGPKMLGKILETFLNWAEAE